MECKLFRECRCLVKREEEKATPSLPETNLRFRIDPVRSNKMMFALGEVTFASYDEISSNFVLSASDFCS